MRGEGFVGCLVGLSWRHAKLMWGGAIVDNYIEATEVATKELVGEKLARALSLGVLVRGAKKLVECKRSVELFTIFYHGRTVLVLLW